MDQRERVSDMVEAVRTAIEGMLLEVWTCLPAIVQDFDPKEGTISCQPAIKGQVRDSKGKLSWVNLPVLIHVPLIFLRSGDFIITFAPKQGDECLVWFSSRCIDEWWRQGGTQPQTSLRTHDLHDGFALVGPFSKPNVVQNISLDTVQLRTVDGRGMIELTKDGMVNVLAPGGIKLQGDVTVDGKVTANGEGTFNGGHTVSQHTHVDPQGGVTGVPQG